MISTSVDWLPIVFVGLMGLSFLIYAILDGYDLGVGVLLPLDNQQQRDTMIYSIGPFWDANETWLVMAIGLLLIFELKRQVTIKRSGILRLNLALY